MSQRKLQQEIDKVFKQVNAGVEEFDSQHEKYDQSTNASQREKLVNDIKKECKKLQRLRDQIKTWHASNEVKDKGPLLEKRELIETKMEAFKAIEKEMKTKAFSKEGLSVTAKMDPKEREKAEMNDFLREQVEELGHQIEAGEAEIAQIQGQAKKPKKDSGKSERLMEVEHRMERHKWHQDKLELLMRALANDDVDAEQVKDSQEDIRHYVENNQEVDFFEDEGIYDEFNLEEESGRYGVHGEMDRVDSQENPSAQDEAAESPTPVDAAKGKTKNGSDAAAPAARRPSQHMKSPFPTLATLNNLPTATPATVSTTMKPAPPPSKPPGETLNYASAAAAAAASTDTSGIGIAPLPPPPSKASGSAALAPGAGAAAASARSSTTTSPAVQTAQPVEAQTSESKPVAASVASEPRATARSPAPSQSSASGPSPAVSATHLAQASSTEQPQVSTSNGLPPKEESMEQDSADARDQDQDEDHDQDREAVPAPEAQRSPAHASAPSQANGVDHVGVEDDESIYHLPESLRELVDNYESIKGAAMPVSQPEHQRMLAASFASRPDSIDAERPRHYKPQNPAAYTPPHYSQEPLPIFDNPQLYTRVDVDALFYSFYYNQGTYQQYLAAKALKAQSWRFHKQYQTWFQRHEEPKSITEDYEQGTYRFFDYESTWMNRRKADFKFAYKFLEDEL